MKPSKHNSSQPVQADAESTFIEAAIKKWPNVPSLYGWLSLDRRGRWLIKNELITHTRTNLFLHKLYRKTNSGQWYVQNGPQKAFVTLEYTPYILRIEVTGHLITHTGTLVSKLNHLIFDDEGNVLFETNLGIGLLDDRDIYKASEFIGEDITKVTKVIWKDSALEVKRIRRSNIPKAYLYEPRPSEPHRQW